MKLLKWFTMVAIAAMTIFATSCTKEEEGPTKKPDGFGIQGYWSTETNDGKSFTFHQLPSTNCEYTVGTLTVYGTYTYDSITDKLTFQPNADGAALETYDIKWVDEQFKSFSLIATGSTPKDKEAIYVYTIVD